MHQFLRSILLLLLDEVKPIFYCMLLDFIKFSVGDLVQRLAFVHGHGINLSGHEMMNGVRKREKKRKQSSAPQICFNSFGTLLSSFREILDTFTFSGI